MNKKESDTDASSGDISSLAEQIDEEERRDRRRAGASIREEAQDLAAKLRRQRRLLGILVAVFVVLTGVNLAGLNPFMERAPAPSEDEVELSALAALEMVVEDVEQWRAENGELPANLDELTETSEGWSYSPTEGAGYRISHTIDGVTVSYESGQDLEEVFSPLYDPPKEE